MIIISAKNLIKEYTSENVLYRVINGIDLDVSEGDFLAVKGESGSGKSTLLYLLSGLETPTSGVVTFLNKDFAQMKDAETAKLRRSKISFVYQFYNLLPNLSIYDNIVLPKQIDKCFNDAEKQYLEELICLAGIKNILKKLPSEVSGGEQQRAAIVRAVFVRPAVLFADEPTGSLDSKSGMAVINLLKKINDDYKTAVVMVTHSAEQAASAKKVINIKDGKITENV